MATSMPQNLVSLVIDLACFVLFAVTMMKFDRFWTFATVPPAILLISLATASPFSFATLCLLSTGLMVTVASPGRSLRRDPGSESPRGLFCGLTTTVNPLSTASSCIAAAAIHYLYRRGHGYAIHWKNCGI